jgi:PleD family two-component response regulator
MAKDFPNLGRPSSPLKVTASFGVSAVDASLQDPKSLLRAADQACFAAKRAGKNRVSTHART